MFEDEAILNEFVVESVEHLANIENQLLSMESAGADVDVDLVNTVFRGVHSIKGAAGFLGLRSINNLAHSLENVLNLMRERELIPDSANIDAMLRAADLLSSLIQDVANSNAIDVTNHVDVLEAIAVGDSASATSEQPFKSPPPKVTTAQAQSIDVRSSTPEATQEVEPTAPAQVTPPTRQTTESSIRVSVDTIDYLMNLAGELVLGRNQLLQTITARDQAGLDAVAARLNQVTSEMQDAIMQARMQPMGNVFNRFTRVVRDLSNQLGKRCRVEITGSEVEVDKTIIEAIGDPLTHLIRNSVDHGLETPDQRTAAGKRGEGLIQLRAMHQSDKVRIEVQDDGGGIDTERLKRKAVERGLLTADAAQTMSDQEAARLIFHPGFSTADKVSDVSGRGVGMDVVRTNIEKLGGMIEVDTKAGAGTTIAISLPLTLAIIPSLIVECGANRYAVPQVNIAELVRVRASEAEQRIGLVKDAEVLRLRGRLLPLVRLRQALGEPEAANPTGSGEDSDGNGSTSTLRRGALNIVVVNTGQLRYGLVVDDLHDSEEIVVKPLGRHFRNCGCISGATILGDGHVALILDVAGVAAHKDLRRIHESESAQNQATGDCRNGREAYKLLLFTNHASERFAIPMSLVARIERIQENQIERLGGKQLLTHRRTTMPLLNLEDFTSAEPREPANRLYVVVFEVEGREVGLIAPQLEDILEVGVEAVDTTTLCEVGFSGALVLDGRPARLVDLLQLARLAEPDWFDDSGRAVLRAGNPVSRILLVEDSDFFRNQVKQFLLAAGHDVVEAVDGQAAWELLQTEDLPQAVVTDVEMPRMTGLDLCRHIRGDERCAGLPVVALSSLASEDDVRQAREAGVDDYQVKMDREKLLEAVTRLLDSKSAPPHPPVTQPVLEFA